MFRAGIIGRGLILRPPYVERSAEKDEKEDGGARQSYQDAILSSAFSIVIVFEGTDLRLCEDNYFGYSM